MTNDENSDLIGGYKSDDSSIEGGDEVTVLVCDKIKRPEEKKYNYISIVKIISSREKDSEWVGSVTNPKDECNYQVGKLVKWLGDTGASSYVIGISDVL